MGGTKATALDASRALRVSDRRMVLCVVQVGGWVDDELSHSIPFLLSISTQHAGGGRGVGRLGLHTALGRGPLPCAALLPALDGERRGATLPSTPRGPREERGIQKRTRPHSFAVARRANASSKGAWSTPVHTRVASGQRGRGCLGWTRGRGDTKARKKGMLGAGVGDEGKDEEACLCPRCSLLLG